MRGIESWEKVRSQGFARFVLLRGVLAWGLPMFLFMTFVTNWGRLTVGRVLLAAVIWALAGVAFGAFLWWANDRQSRKRTGGA